MSGGQQALRPGGLVAGLALSAVMLAGEKLSERPSELIELERKTAAKLGVVTRTGDAPATGTEQLVTQAGTSLCRRSPVSPMRPRSMREPMT